MRVDAKDMGTDLKSVLITKEEIDAKLAELAAKIDAEYVGKDLLIVGVLKGAVMVMADLARALSTPVTMDWMAVSSYGAGTQSSGVVRILKDLDTDIKGKHVLIVEDIIDSGLTLSWLISNLGSREAGLPQGVHAAAQAGGGQGRDRRGVGRLRHPERVRDRLRPRLRGEVPQPPVRRYARASRLRRLNLRVPVLVRRSGTPAGFAPLEHAWEGFPVVPCSFG